MKTFFRNIKEHWLIALVCFLVLAGIIAGAVLLNRSSAADKDGSETASEAESSADPEKTVTTKTYFEDRDYPVKVEDAGDTLTAELDGSKSAELKWVSAAEPAGIIDISESGKETEGRLKVVISPKATGYSTVTFSRSLEVNGFSANIAEIEAEILVYDNEAGEKVIKISDMRESIAAAGALDTKTPYVISGNRVVLPGGGDWELTANTPTGVSKELYVIVDAVDEKGFAYYQVKMDPTRMVTKDGEFDQAAMSSFLLLKSKSLGKEQKLVCSVGEDGKWLLSAVEGE